MQCWPVSKVPETSTNHPSFLDEQVKTITKFVFIKDQVYRRQNPRLRNIIGLVVMKKLEKNTVEIEVENPLTGSPMKVKIGPFGLSLVLRLDIDDERIFQYFQDYYTALIREMYRYYNGLFRNELYLLLLFLENGF